MYKLYALMTILNATTATLYFVTQRPVIGGIWTVATIIWTITTILNYRMVKK